MRGKVWALTGAVFLIVLSVLLGLSFFDRQRSMPQPELPSDEKDGAFFTTPEAQKLHTTKEIRTPRVLAVFDERLKPLLDSSAPVDKRIASDIAAKIPCIETEHDRAAVAQVLTDPEDDDTVRNEVANLLRRSKYFGLTDALLSVLDNPAEKPRFRSFAVQHLWQQLDSSSPESRGRIEDKLRALLSDRHVEVRREALLALVRMKDSTGKETAVRWLTAAGQEADNTRDLAIRCVYDLDLREHISTIRKYACDSNEVIRIAAIAALSQWGDEESWPVFEEAAKSPVVRIRRAGKAALERLNSANGSANAATP